MTYRILVLGDFLGRASRGQDDPVPIHERRRMEVDRDNLEELMGKLRPKVRLASGEELVLSEVDDFGPESFVRVLPSFDELRSVRRRLGQPGSFEAAARELGAVAGTDDAAVDEAGSDRPEGIAMPEGLLSAAMEQTEVRAKEPDSGSTMIESLARQWAAPFVVPAKDPRLPDLLAAVDGGMQALARAVLRDPAFRAAEDAWRGLDRLTRALETGADLKVEILDVTPQEIGAAGPSLRHFGGAGEALAPDVVVMLHRFGAGDLPLLETLATAAHGNGAVLVADALPELVGGEGERLVADAGEWSDASAAPSLESFAALRSSFGESVVLVPNRVLMRLSYGKRGASVEGFAFEELEAGDPASAPWGSGAWAVAYALGVRRPDGCQLSEAVEVDRLPVCLVEVDGELTQIPCAEVVFGDAAIEALVSRGFTALRGARGADSIQVGPLVPIGGR